MNKFKTIIKVAATVADLIVATSIMVDVCKYGYNKLMKNKKTANNNSDVETVEFTDPVPTEN